MAEAKRSEWDVVGAPPPQHPAVDGGFQAGGSIADMQADLACRLAGRQVGSAAEGPVSAGERAVRLLSVAAGYGSLAAGYAVVTVAIVWYM